MLPDTPTRRVALLGALLAALLLLATAPLAPPASAASKGPTVAAALAGLKRSGAIPASAYSQYYDEYLAAQRALKKLSGTRREELASVLTNVQEIAAAREFTPTRLPALFLTVERNLEWWTTKPLLSADERVSFPGSHIIWEFYPGQGIEIQWLATFGEANGYYLQGHENEELEELLGEVIPLATARAGGIAWEYMFHFDGGSPPWTSGLSQGTALQALARAYSRLKTPAYLTAAKAALGIFQTPPPAGVRVATAAGAHYLEYTYAPQERILNGFIQSLNGLYDYTKYTGDPLGQQLFEAGDAQARLEVPHYDTGAWSMYDQHSESNLNYHELLTEFLQDLCTRTTAGEPLPAPPAPTPPTAPTPPAPSGGTSSSASATTGSGGGISTTDSAATGGATATTSQASAAIPGDAIYCTTAARFTADIHTPPAIALLTHKLRGGTRGGVQFSLSKIASVGLTVRKGTSTVWSNAALVESGKPRLLWITPTKAGVYSVTLRAVDLAGNSTTVSGTITVSAAVHG
jgi:hypothetical protein